MPETPTTSGFVWRPAHTITLIVLCLTQLLETLDITVVNVALPTLRTALNFSPAGLQWVVNAYTVFFGGFLLLGGRAGDLLGRRRVFVTGTVVFASASLISALASNATTLIAGRGLQGIAAGFVSPMTLAIIAATFPEGKARTRAVTAWGAVSAVSASIGLVLGGVLVDGPGWRWIFLINLPLCALVLVAAIRYLPADRPQRRHHKFDAFGAVAATAGVGLFAYAVAQTADHAWGSASTLSLLGAAAIALILFAIRETRTTEPLIPPSLFANRSVTGANLVQFLSAAAMYALFYFMSLDLQEVLGFSALGTAAVFMPLSAVLLMCAGLGPWLVRMAGQRITLGCGALIVATGMTLYAGLSPWHGTLGTIIVPSMVVAFGFALILVPLTIAAVSGVAPSEQGVASGLLNVSRTVGGALGLAVIATVATSRTTRLGQTGHTAHQALTGGFHLGYGVAAGVAAAAAVAAMIVFGTEGRGERVDMLALAVAGAGRDDDSGDTIAVDHPVSEVHTQQTE
ncbi:MAG: putative antibiotic antiporter [Nocardia sp.]|uniref:MFS transporter n=1 Tax=Nocardia sp. TaxID=1821 RepID=UPI002634C96E|nr:MFS transporter [Nocardia sp.]MCU1644059.1 putative antibiotic antiporter [Nocardia sp.]